ncbi:MAG: TonB-dependent receptor [Burkholderiales bacterium]|nr:TonB-dependent receptor [Burkholderiales bacterium]
MNPSIRRAIDTLAHRMPRALLGTFCATGLACAQAQPAVSSATAGATIAASSPAPQVVVISATRLAMAMADAPAAMSVVPRETIEQLGADDLLEALRGESGITLFGRTIGGRKTLALRGMESRHTLYLVDGRRIGASDGLIGHTDFQLGWVAVEEIERIEVVRGPLSALYGAEALGGVLQIVTRAPSAKLEGSATTEGSWAEGGRGGGGHRAAARVSGPLAEGMRIAVVAADTRRSAIASPSDPRISELEGRHKHDGGVRVAWDAAANHRIEFDARSGLEERFGHAVERSGRRRVYFTDTDVRRSHGALSWFADWAGAGASGASGAAAPSGEWRSQLAAYGSHLAMVNARSNGVAALRSNALADDVLDGQVSGRPAADHLLVAGFEARRERLSNTALPGGRSSAEHRSIYAHDEFALRRELSLSGGLRYDEHERFGSVWSPRLYAVWQAAPQWTVKGGASRGFKPPTLKQITPGYAEDEGPNTFFSDPTLQPETSTAFELGAGFDEHDFGATAMLFHNRVHDLIVPRFLGTVAGRDQYIYASLDDARLQGLELAFTLREGRFTLTGNWQWLDAKDGAGQRLERRPRVAAGLGLHWDEGPWHARWRADHVSTQLLAAAAAGQPPQRVPSLTTMAASLGRRLDRGLDLELGVNNLDDLSLAQRSPLFTWAEAPRTWRLTLRGRW